MKISKLFHWLYAILMLLPFAFFVPSVLYYAFNDNATMQSVEVPKTETIAVDFNQLANVNDDNTYNNYGLTYDYSSNTFNCEGTYNVNGSTALWLYFRGTLNHKYLVRNGYVDDYLRVTLNGSYSNYDRLNNDMIIPCTQTENPFYFLITAAKYNQYISFSNTISFYDLTKMFGSGNEPTIAEFNQYFPLDYYPYTDSELMQITYDTGETEQLVSNTDIINYAWESIWDLPLFSWTKVTFVSVPFAYITGLFGLAASNSLNYLFGYFATISICWLVFDVIMYVPMLVHRWIDKARIE